MNKILTKTKKIVWDFNGTLLNDLDITLETLNDFLKARNLRLATREEYQEHFDFPVINFYKRFGLLAGEEEFRKLSIEFMKIYFEKIKQAGLYPEIQELLTVVKKLNFSQSVLSAMEHKSLTTLIQKFDIAPNFQFIMGIENHEANGKIHKGEELKKKLPTLLPEEVLLFGDTSHDFQVATHCGWNAILIANGHESYSRLSKNKTLVLKNHQELLDYLNSLTKY